MRAYVIRLIVQRTATAAFIGKEKCSANCQHTRLHSVSGQLKWLDQLIPAEAKLLAVRGKFDSLRRNKHDWLPRSTCNLIMHANLKAICSKIRQIMETNFKLRSPLFKKSGFQTLVVFKC
jgi:hypothetical protein